MNFSEETISRTQQKFTTGEEIANSVTHGIGIGLSIAALVILVVFASLKGDAWRVVSFSIYGTTLVLLYSASTFYHAFRNPQVKHLFHIFDHAAIYLLIAGTYTPFSLVNLRGPWGWTMFGIIWGLTFVGIFLKTFFVGRFRVVSTLVYVLMGWMVVIAIKPMIQNVPPGGLIWMVTGGLSYTLGVIFYSWRSLKYHHAVWHLFVLGGSICHFFSILLYVLPGE